MGSLLQEIVQVFEQLTVERGRTWNRKRGVIVFLTEVARSRFIHDQFWTFSAHKPSIRRKGSIMSLRNTGPSLQINAGPS
jgi:hypothetical protein